MTRSLCLYVSECLITVDDIQYVNDIGNDIDATIAISYELD